MNARNKNIVYGKAVRPNAGIRAWYRAALLALTRDMEGKVKNRLLNVYGKYEDQVLPGAMDANLSSRTEAVLRQLQKETEREFTQKSQQLAERFVARTDAYARNSARESVKGMLNQAAWAGFEVKGQTVSQALAAVLKAEVYDNVNYITSIPKQYFKDIAGAVFRNIAQGKSADEIEKVLTYTGRVAQRRAELIARDQSQKAFESLSRQHMKAAGITHFEWVATGGGMHPRPLHHKDVKNGGLNHGIFSFDDPPVIDEGYTPKTPRGTARGPVRGFPGDLPYCQCIKRPVLVMSDKQQIL